MQQYMRALNTVEHTPTKGFQILEVGKKDAQGWIKAVPFFNTVPQRETLLSLLRQGKVREFNEIRDELSHGNSFLFDGYTVCNFMTADLRSVILSGANLSYANLSWANLSDANLHNSNLSWANISYACLKKAIIPDANLSYADLDHSDLSEAILSRSNLSHTDLTHCILTGADLSEANMQGSTVDISEGYYDNQV